MVKKLSQLQNHLLNLELIFLFRSVWLVNWCPFLFSGGEDCTVGCCRSGITALYRWGCSYRDPQGGEGDARRDGRHGRNGRHGRWHGFLSRTSSFVQTYQQRAEKKTVHQRLCPDCRLVTRTLEMQILTHCSGFVGLQSRSAWTGIEELETASAHLASCNRDNRFFLVILRLKFCWFN